MQKEIHSRPQPHVEFDFSRLPQQTEHTREEIKKTTIDTLSILGEMGLKFSHPISLRILDRAVCGGELYHSTEAYHKDLISLVQRLAQIRLEKDSNGQWKDVVILPIDHKFIGEEGKLKIKLSLAHEFAHLWMFQNTQFGKDFFPLRERLAQQEGKDYQFFKSVVVDFGEINLRFSEIVSDTYFQSLSSIDQFDAITRFLPDMINEIGGEYEILAEAFSQESTSVSFKKAKQTLGLLEIKSKFLLRSNHIVTQAIRNNAEELISELQKQKTDKSEDEKSSLDYFIHTIEVERDNKLKEHLIEKFFLEKGAHQFYLKTSGLIEKTERGNNVDKEIEALEKDIFTAGEDLFKLQQTIDRYISEPRVIEDNEMERFNNSLVFIEGFSKFVEEKFIEEYRRDNPNAGTDEMKVVKLPDSTEAALSLYIKGLALFKSKYSSVREAMEGIRAMSMDEIQKEFLS